VDEWRDRGRDGWWDEGMTESMNENKRLNNMAVIDFDISHIVLHLIRLKLLFLLFHVIYVLLLKCPNPFLYHI